MTNPVRAGSPGGAIPFPAAAAQLAALNIAVFPLSTRDKVPPKGFAWRDEATADADRVAAWWRRTPYANVAIATGAPAGFWVLDIDGPEGAAALAALEAAHGGLPETVEQSTGKGRHLCFAWDPTAPEIRNSASKIGPGVDVRGAGGYIVAAPSIHPSGRTYQWRPGHSPWERTFAPAPGWLTEMATPPAPVEPSEPAPKPMLRQDGRASPYGEAALTRACADVAGAPAGQQDLTLFWRSYSIGRLVGGGEIETAYAASALKAAGGQMRAARKPWSPKEIGDKVERGLERGQSNPKVAPERRNAQAATPRRAEAAATPAERAAQANDARGLWSEAQTADCGSVRTWLKLRGLPHEGDWAAMALRGLRAHPSAPVNAAGDRLPCLLAPMGSPDFDGSLGDAPDCVAVLPLTGGRLGIGAERFVWFVGEAAGKAVVIAPPVEGQMLVALDLKDAWALGAAALEGEDPMGVVVTPTLSAFCGGSLGDRFGRVSVETPRSDPAFAPWTLKDQDVVYLAARGDLTPPELKVRKVGGGTKRVRLTGEEARQYCGGLAEQAWRREGANRVRLLKPGHGCGYHSVAGRNA